MLLTNGITWILYHLSFEEGIEYTRAFVVDLSADGNDKCCELLALIHRQSLAKGDLEEWWAHRAALSPASLGRALFTEDVLRRIRRELRKQEDILIDPEDLADALHEMLSTEARELIGPMKIWRKSKSKSKVRAAAKDEPAPKPAAENAKPLPATCADGGEGAATA
ncbi:MAG: hypothetical protein HYS13_05765 [Planctomycetia bacterium]|nr:hypothetical protein [Planctomycetia bacterium]